MANITHTKKQLLTDMWWGQSKENIKDVHSNFFFSTTDNSDCNFLPLCSKKNSLNLLHFQITCMLLTVKSNVSKLTTNQSLIKPHTESCSTMMTRNLSNQLEGKGKITTFNIYLTRWYKSICLKLLQQVCITNSIIHWGCISWKASTWFFLSVHVEHFLNIQKVLCLMEKNCNGFQVSVLK